MDTMAPFESRPALAVAVSGGADSTALAVLARDWAHRRDGSAIALVVDHGLRPASAEEARSTIGRLQPLGIPARLLPLANLAPGPALADRARVMRYQALTDACRDAGILHLLLGHHAGDQMETLAMRVLRGSQTHGLSCMSAVRETLFVRLLRPLLGIEPDVLRRLLATFGIQWVEDPSNRDTSAARPRLRARFQATSPHGAGLTQAIAAVARLRSHQESEAAIELATRVTIRPEGFALLSPGRIEPAVLGSLIQTIGGARYSAASAQVVDLARQLRPATVAGVRIMAAGRFGNGWLVAREEAAIASPAPLPSTSVWDGRFRVVAHHACPTGAMIGKLGDDAAQFRSQSELPSAVLRTLPAVRNGKVLVAVPHIGYVLPDPVMRLTVLFIPARPLANSVFIAASQALGPP